PGKDLDVRGGREATDGDVPGPAGRAFRGTPPRPHARDGGSGAGQPRDQAVAGARPLRREHGYAGEAGRGHLVPWGQRRGGQVLPQAAETPIANVVDPNYSVVTKIRKTYLPRRDLYGGAHARSVEMGRSYLAERR